MIGVYAGDDLAAQTELEKQIKEISDLVAYSQHNECWVDGVLSFRAVLARMGVTVPDTMTEAEAAAEFLKKTQRFSGLLAQWQETVGKRPWDFSAVETKDSFATGHRIFRVAYRLQSLQGLMVQAHLRSDDTASAWSEFQIMNSSVDRMGDVPGFFQSSLRWGMFHTARAGIELGGWTNDQMMEISSILGEHSTLVTARRDMEVQKIGMTDFLTHFRENETQIQEAFSRSKSPIDKMINRFGIATATDQQIADNLAVIHYRMEQPFTCFDPDTGFYLGEPADDSHVLPRSKPSDVSFDKFYYMYSEMYGDPGPVARWIISEQSTIDQTRIAAALEIQRRKTGEYPETLDAVSNSIPRDIATGQPYFYQRNKDGGYTLWGTGIDRKNDGGDNRADVTMTHRPVKK